MLQNNYRLYRSDLPYVISHSRERFQFLGFVEWVFKVGVIFSL